MGGDGGVIASNRRFMRGYRDPNERKENLTKVQTQLKSQLCALSSNPLVEPIVADELGNLFNKEIILNVLIEKKLNPLFSHIRGMKDLKTLKFTNNPQYDATKELNGENISKFICPITRIEFNGIYPFVIIWSTGYVISERAIKELGLDGLQAEYGPFQSNDIIKLIPNDEELIQQRLRMEEKRLLQQNKKSNKRKNEMNSNDQIISSNDKMKMKKSDLILDKNHDTHSKFHSSTNASILPPSSSSSSQAINMTTQSLSLTALNEIKKLNEKSHVYKGLFHDEKQNQKSNRDLFMSVAGIRYTLN
jgi:hypothetical protein